MVAGGLPGGLFPLAFPSLCRGCGLGCQEAGDRVECLALQGDCDAGTAGHVQAAGRLVGHRLPLILEAVANRLGETGLIAVPVHLEAFRVPHVQVVRGHEGTALPVGVGAEAADDHGVEAGLRMGGEPLGGGDLEGVGGVCFSHCIIPFSGWWLGNHSPSVYSLYQASTTIARGCRSADDLEQRCRAALNVVEVTVLGVTKLNPHEDRVRPVALGQRA